MIRRLAAAPLFLSGIIILMSLLVPHHHHSRQICFELSHCHAAQEAGCGCEEPHSAPDSSEEGCLIDVLSRMEVLRQQPFVPDLESHGINGMQHLLPLHPLNSCNLEPVTAGPGFRYSYRSPFHGRNVFPVLTRRGPPALSC